MILQLTEQQIPTVLNSNWIYIKSSSNPVKIHDPITGENTLLYESSVLTSEKHIGRVLISGDGRAEILHGKGKFTAPSDGNTVKVSSLPPVEIASIVPVEIAVIPAVDIASIVPVDIATIPDVGIKSIVPVDIATIPAVDIANIVPVDIATIPDVGIKSIVPVDIATIPDVVITKLPDVIKPSLFTNIKVDTFPHTVVENLSRNKLILKASNGNSASIILIGGFELNAGESLELETTAEINLSGINPDSIFIIEV